MNILYLCDEYPPSQHGGIGTVTQTLATAIAKRGHTVVVAGFYPFYRKAAAQEMDEEVKIYRFFYGSKWKLKLSKHWLTGRFINIKNEFDHYIHNLNKLIDQYKIEIVEIPDFNEAFDYGQYTTISFEKLKAPIIVKLHGTKSYFSQTLTGSVANKAIYFLEQNLLNKASGIIAISEVSKKINQEIYNPFKSIIKIPNGIYIDENLVYNGRASNIVVFAGTLTEKKGVFQLAKAWKIVNEKFPTAQLHIYGEGQEYFNYQMNREIPNGIKLFGTIPNKDLLKIYTTAACAVFPSYSETLGMTPIEAMSVGCPTIFTKRSTGPEIIETGINGLLVDPDNIEEIARAIINMLTNRQQSIEMGQKAKRKVITLFEINTIADKHIKYYKTII